MTFFVLPILIALCLGGSVFLLAYYGYGAFTKGRDKLRRHIEARSVSELDELHQEMDGQKFFLLSILSIVVFTLFFLLLFGNWIALTGTLIGYLAPKFYLGIMVKQRRSLLLKQLPDAVSLMANAMKAGNSLPQAMEAVYEEMESPISQEFHLALQRYRLGVNLQECLQQFERKINDPDFSMIITATLVSMQTGSNLAEMYGRLATTIRQKSAIQNKIKSLTGQGKMQGVVVGLLPVGLLMIINVMNPGTLDFFTNSVIGGALLSLAIILEVMGIFFIRKIVSIDV